MIRRRDVLKSALASAWAPLALADVTGAGKIKLLYFTRSAGFEHSVVRRHAGEESHSETNLIAMGRRSGFEVECTKDGRIFDASLQPYDAIAFFTTGNLTGPAKDGSPPMTAAGKQKLLDAIAGGKGFVGIHSAADTFHSKGRADENQTSVDPYIAMLGAESLAHGAPQEASLLAPSDFLSKNIGVPSEALSFTDEWYTFKNFAKDLHAILVQETRFMKGDAYHRPDYPATWARIHGRGRVFYTSLGHREEVWTDPFFHAIVQAGVGWVTNRFDFDVAPNLEKAAPQAGQLKS